MWNPYLDEFNELQEQSTFKGQQWFGKRKDLVETYSWAVPSAEALIYVSEFDKITEVGAGSGYWANCIERADGNVVPYDIETSGDEWVAVEQCAVEDMPDDCFEHPVLLVWPALREGVATEVGRQEPPHILYVGEPRGGCTGESSFFDIVEQKYGLAAKVDIPSYVGIHDNLYHYIRKV